MFCVRILIVLGNGSSPAQNSTRSISPNTNTTSVTLPQQPLQSPQPIQTQQAQSSPQSQNLLLTSSASLGSLTPTFSSPQQVFISLFN